MKCRNVENLKFQFAQCQTFWKKPKGYRPWSLACFSFLFSSIAHILLLIHDMVSNFGGE
jgi:hypothetical protein